MSRITVYDGEADVFEEETDKSTQTERRGRGSRQLYKDYGDNVGKVHRPSRD